MAYGKYSPARTRWPDDYEYKYNCYGEVPKPWTNEMIDAGMKYDEKTMFGDYDEEGFDQYGYSAFDEKGNFVGHGLGVDKAGYTELDYMQGVREIDGVWYRLVPM